MNRSSSAGFSLIEVLVAAAIFVAGVAAVLQLIVLGLAADLGARYRTEATTLAAQKVEEILGAPWGAASSAADVRGSYARRWDVQPLPLNPQSAVTIDVRVMHGGVEQARLIAVKVRRAP
jgi:prepilin-type N-terminal cleavage/methylation domain-containing protein